MLLFLASSASQTLSLLVPHLPKPASGMKLAFINTAAKAEERWEDAPWLLADIEAPKSLGFAVDVIDIAALSNEEAHAKIAGADALLFGGGNTFYLLQEVRRKELDAFIKERVLSGVVYIGSSAGSLLAGPDIETAKNADDKSKAPDLVSTKGLGLIDFVPYPHYTEEQADMIEAMKAESPHKIIPLRDSEALLVTDTGHQILRKD